MLALKALQYWQHLQQRQKVLQQLGRCGSHLHGLAITQLYLKRLFLSPKFVQAARSAGSLCYTNAKTSHDISSTHNRKAPHCAEFLWVSDHTQSISVWQFKHLQYKTQ